MNQDQNNLSEVESAQTAEKVFEEKIETEAESADLSRKQKTGYLIAGSVIIASFVLAGSYIYVQTFSQERNISINVPTNVEENEPDNITDLNPEIQDNASAGDPANSEFVHTLANDPAKYDNYYKKLLSQGGVAWQEHPTPVGDLKLFSVVEEYPLLLKDKKFPYYKIGTVDSNSLYVAFIPYCEMGCANSVLYFIENSPEQYTYLEKQSINGLTSDPFVFTLAKNVKVDKYRTLIAHQVPEKITVGGVEFSARQGSGMGLSWGPAFFADTYYNTAEQEGGQVTEFFAETEYGPAFRGFRDMGEKTQDLDYAIRLAGGLMVTLNYKPDFIGDDRVPIIRWLDGTNNESAYRTDGLGSCGGGGPEIMKEAIPSESLVLAGNTINQDPVYQVTDTNQYVITRLFNEGETRNYYEYNSVTGEAETKQITKQDFINERGVIIYVDEFGFQHILTHTKYGPQAECAKPVVYLYPEKTTNIRVELDALVTVSEPEYDSGWDVTAHPDGTIFVNGEKFESLFWDGYGNGEYPELKEGFIVPTDDAISLMKVHMKTMGFNEKEISDFVEFWEPHMPDAPYTKFSWIGTVGMENLAKLTINPKPDTLIRAFVDFEGLDNMIEIQPQTIPSYERRGFVATEWGGLLKR